MTNTYNSNLKKDLLFIEGLRGIAASIVMIGHARWLLWEGYSSYIKHPEDYTLINKLLVYFFSIFRFGHESVLFFFILSGFVIHLKYAKALKLNSTNFKFDFWEYLFRRFKRIYPPLIASIILTFILDYIGIYMELPIYFSNTSNELINRNITVDHSIVTLVGNLFLVMKTYTPVWGTNGPLWSLKYEWWFFMFYPIILFFRTKNILFALIMLLLFFILSLLQLFPIKLLNDIFYYMILWWLGSLLADVYIGNIKIKIKYLTLLSMFIIVPLFFNKFYDHFISLGLTGILALFLYLKQNNSSIINYLGKISFLGSFSYTLYIIHFPILVFLAGLILKYNDNQFSKSFHFIFIGIILSYILSYILSIFIEKPFISKYDTKN